MRIIMRILLRKIRSKLLYWLWNKLFSKPLPGSISLPSYKKESPIIGLEQIYFKFPENEIWISDKEGFWVLRLSDPFCINVQTVHGFIQIRNFSSHDKYSKNGYMEFEKEATVNQLQTNSLIR